MKKIKISYVILSMLLMSFFLVPIEAKEVTVIPNQENISEELVAVPYEVEYTSEVTASGTVNRIRTSVVLNVTYGANSGRIYSVYVVEAYTNSGYRAEASIENKRVIDPTTWELTFLVKLYNGSYLSSAGTFTYRI